MRSFFKYVLATVVGIVVSSFVIFLALVIFIGAAIKNASKSTDTVVPGNSVLYVSLDHGITEKTESNPFNDLNLPGYASYKTLGLDDIVERIKSAKDDDNIKGIYLNPTTVNTGFASLKEIRDALVDFKSNGKFIYAYSEVYSQKAYYLASAADSVFVNPSGSVDFRGLSSSILFMKDAFDKLGVDMQVIKVGTFKSAVEPLIMNQMSDENRLQVTSYLNSIYDTFLSGISESRALTVDSLKAIADGYLVRNAETALGHNLVDQVVYKDEVLSLIKNKLGIEEKKDISAVSLMAYRQKDNRSKSKDRIAVLYAYGDIVDGEGTGTNIGGDRISRELRKLRQDERVKAVVLRVNSPGGSALASDIIWREVELTKAVKPVMVSMGDYAASGGYYISVAADSVFAEAGTITGSIGVFGVLPNLKGLLNNKLGLHFDEVKTGRFAAMGASLDRPLTAEERNVIQMEVERIYDTFLDRVANGRNLSVAQVDSIGQGRVWTGTQALNNGLVDEIGGLERAVDAAAAKAELEDYRIVKYPVAKDPFSSLFSSSKERIRTFFVGEELGEYSKYLMDIKKVLSTSGLQARLPYEIEVY